MVGPGVLPCFGFGSRLKVLQFEEVWAMSDEVRQDRRRQDPVSRATRLAIDLNKVEDGGVSNDSPFASDTTPTIDITPWLFLLVVVIGIAVALWRL